MNRFKSTLKEETNENGEREQKKERRQKKREKEDKKIIKGRKEIEKRRNQPCTQSVIKKVKIYIILIYSC